jgi:hypothetical protein
MNDFPGVCCAAPRYARTPVGVSSKIILSPCGQVRVRRVTGQVPQTNHLTLFRPVVTRAAEENTETGSSDESAPFCPRVFLLSAYRPEGWLVGAVGIENSTILPKPHKQRRCNRSYQTITTNTTKTQGVQSTSGSWRNNPPGCGLFQCDAQENLFVHLIGTTPIEAASPANQNNGSRLLGLAVVTAGVSHVGNTRHRRSLKAHARGVKDNWG